MTSTIAKTTVFSKVSVKSQTVLPAEVRKRLAIRPGDRLRYILDETGVRVEKAGSDDEFDPFASFSEWSSPEDEERLPTFEAADFKAGDIIVVPFPFSDRLAGKRRPALVVSGPKLAAEEMVWVVMVTTSRKRRSASDCRIVDRVAAGLDADCVVRPTKIAGLEPARITSKIGRLGDRETAQGIGERESFHRF